MSGKGFAATLAGLLAMLSVGCGPAEHRRQLGTQICRNLAVELEANVGGVERRLRELGPQRHHGNFVRGAITVPPVAFTAGVFAECSRAPRFDGYLKRFSVAQQHLRGLLHKSELSAAERQELLEQSRVRHDLAHEVAAHLEAEDGT